MPKQQTYVALLRGVNVGGRQVPMKQLAELVASLGHEDVRTYIQSGNVVFRSSAAASKLAHPLERAIEEGLGLDLTVILRSAAQLRRIAAGNPFRDDATAAPRRLHVVVFDGRPTAAALGKLDPDRSPGDAIRIYHSDGYLYLPNRAGRTKLTLNYLERALGVRGTQRNWNTLLKLIELTGSPGGG